MIISEQEKKRILKLHEATSTSSSGSYETPLFGQPEVEQIFDFMGGPDIVIDDEDIIIDDEDIVDDEDVVTIDIEGLDDLFDMTDEDDEERMRVLHKEHSIVKEQVNQMGTGSGFLGTQGESDRLSKFTQRQEMGEASEDLYEGMDATNIDLEAATEAFDEAKGEEMDNWDDLDDNIKDTLRQHKEFKNMEEDAIREKFNSMDSTSICKILRFAFGWLIKLFRAPLSYMDKQLQGGMGGKHYKRRPAWPCKGW